MIGHTRLAAFVLPLALFASLQGGSCRGGAQGGNAGSGGGIVSQSAIINQNANANANTNANANADVSVNATPGANANAAASENTNRNGGKENSNVGDSNETRAMAKGTWGGRSVNLDVSDAGAEIEFDCAHGRMEKLLMDKNGNFEARGVFVRERGGPVRVGQQEDGQPVRYSGRIEGQTMTLTITFEGASEDAEPLSFTLAHGKTGRLTKCL